MSTDSACQKVTVIHTGCTQGFILDEIKAKMHFNYKKKKKAV